MATAWELLSQRPLEIKPQSWGRASYPRWFGEPAGSRELMILRPGLSLRQKAEGKVQGRSPQPGGWSREKAQQCSLQTEGSKKKAEGQGLLVCIGRQRKHVREEGQFPPPDAFLIPLASPSPSHPSRLGLSLLSSKKPFQTPGRRTFLHCTPEALIGQRP